MRFEYSSSVEFNCGILFCSFTTNIIDVNNIDSFAEVSGLVCFPILRSVYIGSTFNPRELVVERCPDRCQHTPSFDQTVRRKCVVLETQNLTNYVVDIADNKVKQVTLLVHTRCGCECVSKPSDCTKTQIYHNNSCTCLCRYLSFPCPVGFIWSRRQCACICNRSPEVCSVGKVW